MKPKHLLFTLLALFASITASAYEWTDANIANFIMKGSFSGKSSLRKSRMLAGIEDNYLDVQDKELQKNAKRDVEVTLTISTGSGTVNRVFGLT